MQEQSQPNGHTEIEIERGADLLGSTAEIGEDGDVAGGDEGGVEGGVGERVRDEGGCGRDGAGAGGV